MVLGIILMASWMLVQVIARVRDETSLRGVENQNDALHAAAFQALEITIGVLSEIQALDGGLYGPVQGWGDPLAYAGFAAVGSASNLTDEVPVREGIAGLDDIAEFEFPEGILVEIDIRDESGRLPLNQTLPERWKLFFEAMEIEETDAAMLADTLLDWIDADNEPRLNGAEAGTYQRRDPAYLPSNGPLEDLQELALIEGFDRLFFDDRGIPNDRFRTFRDCVTLLPNPAINYNTVHPLVLEALAEELEFEADKVADYVAGPDLEPGTADDRLLRPGLEETDLPRNEEGEMLDFAARCRYLTVQIAAMSAGTVFRLAARLDTETRPPKSVYPMVIMELQTKGSDL